MTRPREGMPSMFADCPYCGQKKGKGGGPEIVPIRDHPAPLYAVRCDRCGAYGPIEGANTPAKALVFWNERWYESQLQVKIEELEDELERLRKAKRPAITGDFRKIQRAASLPHKPR
jgi:hypothetical protein